MVERSFRNVGGVIRLRQGLQARAALACAMLYAVCVLMSSVTFAFAHGGDLLDCLTEHHAVVAAALYDVGKHQHAAMMHEHAGMTHDHGAGGGGSGAPLRHPADPQKHQLAPCCSIFAMVGIVSAPVPDTASMTLPAASFPLREDALDGRGPDRINRPPIA